MAVWREALGARIRLLQNPRHAMLPTFGRGRRIYGLRPLPPTPSKALLNVRLGCDMSKVVLGCFLIPV